MRERLRWFWRRIRGQKVHKVTPTTIGAWDDSAIDDPAILDEALFMPHENIRLRDNRAPGAHPGVEAARYFGVVFGSKVQRDTAIRLMESRIHRERVAGATRFKNRSVG